MREGGEGRWVVVWVGEDGEYVESGGVEGFDVLCFEMFIGCVGL